MAMPEQHETVVSFLDFLEATLKELDESVPDIKAWAAKRQEIALRLAILRAAKDPEVIEAAEDYERRVAEDRPYEDARPAEDVLREAHARYGTG